MERNYSLILKIAVMIFLAFAVILGNEIRIGVDRYITNTLKSDAATNARNMEKLEKAYIEDYINYTNKMQTSHFLTVYDDLLDDASKIKCLTDSKGNIVDISRPGFDNPVLHIVMMEDDKKEVMIFDISSIPEEVIDILSSYLVENSDTDHTVELSFKGDNQLDNSAFYDINVKRLVVDDKKLYENSNVEGNIKTYKGYIGYFSNIDYEILYEIENSLNNIYFDGLDGEIVEEKVVIYDYSNMRKILEDKLKNDFKNFTSNNDNFMNTSYSQYYLLDLIEDEDDSSASYSVTMCKFLDWFNISKTESVNDLDELEELVTEGYCFIIQKYNHLYLEAMSMYVADNISTYSLTVLLMGLICIGLGYIIVQPIRRIERVAQAISQKDFNVKLKSDRYDEIGSLARSINSMGSELEMTINNLNLEIDRVKQLEDIRKEFVSNFTHEIKTPLGIINGFSELIEIETDESKKKEYIDIIQQETRKINELVLAMLDLSKLESKNVSLDISQFDIVTLCEDILEAMQVHIENKKINLQRDFHSYMIDADYHKVEMILTNLISNAIRYTHENGNIYITVNDMGFYIENEGRHIAEEDLTKIWLPFQKGDKSRNDKGTGLGLSIVKAALDLHNMKYGVVNTQKGVLFYFEYR